MFHKIKKIWKDWRFQLILFSVPLILGFICYCIYYYKLCEHEVIPWTMFMPVYSTLELFTFDFAAKPNAAAGITGYELFFKLLVFARILSVFAIGHALFRVLHPLIKQIWSNFKYRILWKKHEQVLIIGDNKENKMIYRSAENENDNIRPMILCASDENFFKVYDEGFFCLFKKPNEVIESLLEDKMSDDESRCTIIINTLDEEKNLALCATVVDCVRKYLSDKIEEIEKLKKTGDSSLQQELIRKEKSVVEKLDRIRVMVFGSKRYEASYRKFEQESYGILRYTYKARKSALDLITRYPLTSFIDRSRYINEYGCVDKNFDINVIFIGFGNINQEIFSASTIINQFIEADEGEIPQPKKINYYIYDKNDIKARSMNHQIFRYTNEFLHGIERELYHKEDYLEIPPDPTAYLASKIDINSPGFYEQLWAVCSVNPKSLNVISVALGDDLENIDIAQKLTEKAAEWQLPETLIFVNVKNAENYRMLDERHNIIPYSCEKDVIFRFDHIFSNELEEMARKKHYMNALIMSGKGKGLQGTADEIEIDSLYEWYTYDAIQKMSSLYSILSIRSKLQMMGLDYRRKRPDSTALKSNEEYFEIYAGNNRPQIDPKFNKINNMDIYCYPKCLEKDDLTRQSLRQNLAIQEHTRWNASMISFGFIPASIDKIVKDTEDHGKDYRTRTHGNLTTAAGLIDFRKLTTEPGKEEISADVLNNNFHLMDDVWWYLDMFGYEIYKR